MPISAEQWRSVVGSNSIKRPRQIGPKGCFDKARGRSRCGNKQLSADETTFSVASLIHGLSAPSYIGVVFGLLWLWSYQYTDTRVLMEPGRCLVPCSTRLIVIIMFMVVHGRPS